MRTRGYITYKLITDIWKTPFRKPFKMLEYLTTFQKRIIIVSRRKPRHPCNMIGCISGQFLRYLTTILKIYLFYYLFVFYNLKLIDFHSYVDWHWRTDESYCDANEFYYSNASDDCKKSEFVEETLGKMWRSKIYE